MYMYTFGHAHKCFIHAAVEVGNQGRVHALFSNGPLVGWCGTAILVASFPGSPHT